MSYKAVLFDLDGTLLDTLDDLADAMNEALESFGFSAHPVDAYRVFVGDGIRNEAIRALPEGRRDEVTVERCVEECRRRYNACWSNKTRPYAGISELLDELEKRKIPKVILSNKPEEFVGVMVDKLLGRWSFDVVMGLGEDTPRKPDPSCALAIADKVGVTPGEFVYVGDTDTDMKTAMAAGMYAVGVLWGFRDANELNANGAKRVIKHPSEILDLFDAQANRI